MSTRRVELVHGGNGRPEREALFERLVLREVERPQQLEEAEEPVHVVVERDRGEEQHVPAARGDRLDRAPGRVARVTGRPAQAVGFVDDQQVDAGVDAELGQPRLRDERLDRHDRAPVHVERIEARAILARHVGEPLVVEQHEDLVVLAPQLAEPLDRQSVGRDHEAALGAAGPQEAAQDQARLDGLAEAHLVGEEPPHRVGRARARGRVELVGEEPDATAEEGAEALRFAPLEEVQRVEAVREVLDGVEVARGEPLDEVVARVDRPEVRGVDDAPVREAEAAVALGRGDTGLLAARGEAHAAAGVEVERGERRGVRREPQLSAGARELDHEGPAFHREDDSRPEARVEEVGETVAGLPDHGAGHLIPRAKSPGPFTPSVLQGDGRGPLSRPSSPFLFLVLPFPFPLLLPFLCSVR